MQNLRLIIDGPLDGCWNMAIDEALLTSAGSPEALPTLRFYQWSQPTLSLGYFQPVHDRKSHPNSIDCPMVRRTTGGGAILHDQELTYSFTTPVETRFGQHAVVFYREFHEQLACSLAKWGIHCEVREGTVVESLVPPPFLCFQRYARGDLICGSSKVAGSAQRRRRRALLQHGSVVLETSKFAPEIAGVENISGVKIATETLIERWSKLISCRQEVRLEKGHFRSEEIEWAKYFAVGKFGQDDWNSRR